MNLRETQLPGVWTIDVEPVADERGFFARTFDADQMADLGLDVEYPQCSISFNKRNGTIRALHMQMLPHSETKLVRCISGAIFDVAVDLRPGSDTFGRWTAEELTSDNRRTLYIPQGFAHGFLTLADDTEVSYAISRRYEPGFFFGVRWDDPDIAIGWPAKVEVISARDATLPLLKEARAKLTSEVR